MHASPRVFVIGGVSREAITAVPGRFELASYVARTSMASIGTSPVSDREVREKVAGLSNPFQRRMISNDLDKSTLQLIRSVPHDILLIDFIDERFNLALAGDTLFSLSGELEGSGFGIGQRAVVAPESETFLSLWMAGISRLLASVDQRKVVVNRIYWAERFPDGKPSASRGWVRRNNALLQRLYDTVDRYWSLKHIDYPPGVLIADPNHRWGVAPYHFAAPFHRHAVEELAWLASGEQRSVA